MKHLSLFFVLVLGVVACGKDAAKPADPRTAILESLGNDVIAPSYQVLNQHAQELASASQAHCVSPPMKTRQELKSVWLQMRQTQLRVSMWGVGAYDDWDIEVFLGWEASPKALDALLMLEPSMLDLPRIQQEGANKRGLLAMEYVLFTPDDEEAFTRSRCALLVSLSQDVAQNASKIHEAWNGTSTPERKAFIEAGDDTSRFESRQVLLGVLFNHILARVEYLTYTELGKPSGLKDGTGPNARLVQGGLSDSAKDGFRAVLLGLRQVMWGRLSEPSVEDEEGLIAPTRASNEKLAIKLLAHVDEVEANLDALNVPLRLAVEQQPEETKLLFESMQRLVRLIKSEWSSTLGISVTFNDNDGD